MPAIIASIICTLAGIGVLVVSYLFYDRQGDFSTAFSLYTAGLALLVLGVLFSVWEATSVVLARGKRAAPRVRKDVSLARIDAVISDVDGVLTDGGIIRIASGEGGRIFNTKDGMGHTLLRQAGIKYAWISSTKERGSLDARSKDLKVEIINTDDGPKDARLEKVCAQLGVEPARCVFIGDDVIDLCVIGMVGVFACPADAVDEVIERSDIVLSKDGGRGAFRELAEMVIAARSGRAG